MTKPTLTAEEKAKRRTAEMLNMIDSFREVRPENDRDLENNLRSPVALSPSDLVSSVDSERDITTQLPLQTSAPTKDTEIGHPDEARLLLKADDAASDGEQPTYPRYLSASIATPTTEILFKELAPQIRGLKINKLTRRVTVAVSVEVFSRVSHLHFVAKIGKLEVLTFLLERFLPRDKPEKLPRFLTKEVPNESQPRHLTFAEDDKLIERFDWLRSRHGFTKTVIVENIVLHILPPAPFNIPPTNRRKALVPKGT